VAVAGAFLITLVVLVQTVLLQVHFLDLVLQVVTVDLLEIMLTLAVVVGVQQR
jgi:hypothetical protein